MAKSRPVRIGPCPNGYSLLLPFSLVLAAAAFTSVGSFSCQYLRIHDADSGVSYGMGLLSIQESAAANLPEPAPSGTAKCVRWDRDDVDSFLQVARVSSVLTLIAAAVCLVIFVVIGVVRIFEPFLRHILACMCCTFFFIAILMLVTLIVLLSDNCKNAEDCEWNWAGTCSMIAAVIWMVAGCVVCCTPIKQREREVIEKQDKNMDDGSDEDEDDGHDEDDDDDKNKFANNNDKEKNDDDDNNDEENGNNDNNNKVALEDDDQSTTYTESTTRKQADGTIIKVTKTTITHRNGRTTVTQNHEVIEKTSTISSPPVPTNDDPEKKRSVEQVVDEQQHTTTNDSISEPLVGNKNDNVNEEQNSSTESKELPPRPMESVISSVNLQTKKFICGDLFCN
mmetsp:Transcript_8988/g.11955  ORF Transcript_8988/g.11955 Transcript_8988/m.11955 type:complete len:395 (+) Transcript_8988:122-1306(+)|eukprot:CAMPEP_0198141076 /NCGR_PEP_ID=MMETSP1443-20131203/4150_1 /TAXON_ID=186043 /ORGANISM="Entomoneis sp., Strain CCMP2396" /LENGTH=394 /DNA_ID=CAMNT_0043803699 /DNA_START=76 /DNA_END=1260 /DNA_ORIENTATION=+